MWVAYVLFWVSFGVLVYTYVGYGILGFFITRIKKTPKSPSILPADLPAVALIIPAFNEAEWLVQKIENSLRLNYLPGKLQTVFITDGSTDDSNEILRSFPQVKTLFRPERKGKMAAINRAMEETEAEIVVFSDANSMLNIDSIVNIVRHYADEKVGGVAGEKKIVAASPSGIGFTEGLYWKYESLLKRVDSNLNTVVGAAGELFSIRTKLFEAQPGNIILDDFVLSMKICLEGYKVVYEPHAFAMEDPSQNLAEEKKRRVRIAAGAFQSIPLLRPYFIKSGRRLLYFQYFSRRILRWIACPISLMVVFVTNAIIVVQPESQLFYAYFFALQNIFYLLAVIGALFYKTSENLKLIFLPFYFVFMNWLLVLGYLKYKGGKQTVLWEKSQRKVLHSSLQ